MGVIVAQIRGREFGRAGLSSFTFVHASKGCGMGLTVSSGNRPFIVSSGQTDIGGTILCGGTEIVASGGTVSNTTVESGGGSELLGGATSSGTTIFNYGATLELGSGFSIGAPHRWQKFRCCPVDAGLTCSAGAAVRGAARTTIKSRHKIANCGRPSGVRCRPEG
jgi:autotransporter passenger strand-loop-strand repeat protein